MVVIEFIDLHWISTPGANPDVEAFKGNYLIMRGLQNALGPVASTGCCTRLHRHIAKMEGERPFGKPWLLFHAKNLNGDIVRPPAFSSEVNQGSTGGSRRILDRDAL
jgi:hypothetical protein